MKINIPEKYADLYLQALNEKKGLLEAKIEDFKREIAEIENHIRSLTSMPIFNEDSAYINIPQSNNTYQPQWPWTRKITYYQEFKGKLITSNEVVDFIISQEPEQDKAKIRSSVSAALSNRLRNSKYLKFTDPVSITAYYGPSEWFDNSHEPNIEYIPAELKERLFGR